MNTDNYNDEFTLARAIRELIQKEFRELDYDVVKKALDMVKIQYKNEWED